MTALPLAVAGLIAIAALGWLVTWPARRRTPHHAAGPLARRTYPLA
jgi:hypothetical protein